MPAAARLLSFLLRAAAGLGPLFLVPAPGVAADSPYRLHLDAADYRLQLPQAAAPRAGGAAAHSGPLAPLIERHARARGLDPALVHAVVRAESAYRPQALSPKGAVGLMQVMPATGRRFGIGDLQDPEDNLQAGTAYLRYLLGLFQDLPLALAAYNAGEGAVIRHGNRIPPYPETRAYVRSVLQAYAPGPPGAAARPPAFPGTRLEIGGASPYRLVRDPWRGLEKHR